MTDAIEWTMPVAVADLPEEGAEFEIIPDQATRAMVARLAGVLAIPELTARLHVTRQASGALVAGSLRATVRQTCVVMLEPFDNKIDETISLSFVAREAMPPASSGEAEAGGDDPPDPLVDGRVDLAAVIAEFLTLAIDPYPRKPGAVFVAPEEDAPAESPFAALARLAGKNGGKT